MIWFNCRHFCAAAVLDSDGIITRAAPILRGFIGKHYRAAIAFYARKGQLIEAKLV